MGGVPKRRLLPDTIAPSRLVVQLLGTLFFAATLLTARETDALLTDRSDVDGAVRAVRRSRRLAADGPAEAREAVAALRRDVLPLTETFAATAAAHARDQRR
jgi:hypothetical protein